VLRFVSLLPVLFALGELPSLGLLNFRFHELSVLALHGGRVPREAESLVEVEILVKRVH
jgi:hypothetical protein